MYCCGGDRQTSDEVELPGICAHLDARRRTYLVMERLFVVPRRLRFLNTIRDRLEGSPIPNGVNARVRPLTLRLVLTRRGRRTKAAADVLREREVDEAGLQY